jgi:hypothetical protein
VAPSFPHEALVRLFRERPRLAAELVRDALHTPVPPFRAAHVEDAQLGAITPTELQADLVVRLEAERALALIVEMQLSRDAGKLWSWPAYVANLRSRLRCDVMLVVVTVDSGVADWCARPIELGHPGCKLAPLVVGPDVIPKVTEVDIAMAAPELAVLSAMAHGQGRDAEAIGRAALLAAARLDDERGQIYTDACLALLHSAAKEALEAMMANGTYEYQSDYFRRAIGQGMAEGEARGVARGKAEAVLAVLAGRGLAVSDPLRDRVLACTDVARLDAWLTRAITAASAAEAIGE